MTSTQYVLLIGIMIGFTMLEFALGRAQKFPVTAADNALDLLGFTLLAARTSHSATRRRWA